MFFASLVLLFGAGSQSAVSLPAEIVVGGDFDHDGKADIARQLNLVGGGSLLVIERASDPLRPHVLTRFTASDRLYWYKVSADQVRASCSEERPRTTKTCKGLRPKMKGDLLAFGTEEASQAVASWNGQAFDIVWLTD